MVREVFWSIACIAMREEGKSGLLMSKAELPYIKDDATREELNETIGRIMQQSQPIALKQAIATEEEVLYQQA